MLAILLAPRANFHASNTLNHKNERTKNISSYISDHALQISRSSRFSLKRNQSRAVQTIPVTYTLAFVWTTSSYLSHSRASLQGRSSSVYPGWLNGHLGTSSKCQNGEEPGRGGEGGLEAALLSAWSSPCQSVHVAWENHWKGLNCKDEKISIGGGQLV